MRASKHAISRWHAESSLRSLPERQADKTPDPAADAESAASHRVDKNLYLTNRR